jgi:hypothetical protein
LCDPLIEERLDLCRSQLVTACLQAFGVST